MKNLDLYKWIAGSVNDFTKPFSQNEALYSRARGFWGQLEGSGMIMFIVCGIIVGLLLAYSYYKPFNEKAGRHYKPKYWIFFIAITFAASLIITLLFEYIVATPKLDGAFGLEIRIAIGNAVYATLVYFLISVVWCNWFSTNAYRLFKI